MIFEDVRIPPESDGMLYMSNNLIVMFHYALFLLRCMCFVLIAETSGQVGITHKKILHFCTYFKDVRDPTADGGKKSLVLRVTNKAHDTYNHVSAVNESSPPNQKFNPSI